METEPGSHVLDKLSLSFHLIGREIPVRIANCYGGYYPLGLRYVSMFPQYLRIHGSLVFYASPQAEVQCGKTDGLDRSTNIEQGPAFT
jgi:hypothetical protein